MVGLLTVVLAVALVHGVTRLGVASLLRTRAESAADAAALAAADELALGHGERAAVRAARRVAARNGARLVECDCVDQHAEVVVTIDSRPAALQLPRVEARARAEVDPTVSR
jgi:secretion/DNA translocation related TadE-like protein